MQFQTKDTIAESTAWLYFDFSTGETFVQPDRESYEECPVETRCAFEVRFAGPRYDKVEDDLRKPHAGAIRKGTLSTEASVRITCQALARTVIVDCDNVFLEDQPLDITDYNAVAKVLAVYQGVSSELLRFSKNPLNFDGSNALVEATAGKSTSGDGSTSSSETTLQG